MTDTPKGSKRLQAYRRDGPFLFRPPDNEMTEAEELAWCAEMADELTRRAELAEQGEV